MQKTPSGPRKNDITFRLKFLVGSTFNLVIRSPKTSIHYVVFEQDDGVSLSIQHLSFLNT